MNEHRNLNRRRSLDPDKGLCNRKNDSNFRIHIHSTKATSRDKSFITTDSLKLYEDQIILKNPVISEIDEVALQKRPLSLCFDLNSSGEEINTTDNSSSTMSSISSSSSSSSNSKPSVNSSLSNYHSFELDYEKFQDEESIPSYRVMALDDELISDAFDSLETASKESSIVTILTKRSNDEQELSNHNGYTNNPNDNIDVLRPYDFSSSDGTDNESEKSLILECNSPTPICNQQVRISVPETEVPVKEMMEIIKTFNTNNCGMHMYEDNRNRLCCTTKIFVNLTEPVKLGVPSQLPNTSLVSSKTLLPRGGFELVTIDRTSTCKNIIEQIFSLLQIQENYSNYGIFEHTIREGDKVIVKRLGYDYCLMNHLINMVRIEHDRFSSLITSRRFVLQESERVQINWSKFTHCELMNFLRILEREENDRKEKIINYYQNLEESIKLQMKKLKLLEEG